MPSTAKPVDFALPDTAAVGDWILWPHLTHILLRPAAVCNCWYLFLPPWSIAAVTNSAAATLLHVPTWSAVAPIQLYLQVFIVDFGHARGVPGKHHVLLGSHSQDVFRGTPDYASRDALRGVRCSRKVSCMGPWLLANAPVSLIEDKDWTQACTLFA